MDTDRSRRLARWLAAGSALVFLAASAGMSLRVEPFHSWYYAFAWWSYILFLESFLLLGGGVSALFHTPRNFFWQAPFSIVIWLVFEAFNLRLANWRYDNLPADQAVRWIGFAINFATVLPALMATTRLLDRFRFYSPSEARPPRDPEALRTSLLAAGVACAVLPLLWPSIFFPLIWVSWLFLLEPFLDRRGGNSLLAEWRNGSLRTVYLLATAGLICGLLWEMWNYPAGAKWHYTLPFLNQPKLFEMPLVGFIGFPLFATSVYAMANALFLLLDVIDNQAPARCAALKALFLVVMGVFSLTVFHLIDVFTVISFR